MRSENTLDQPGDFKYTRNGQFNEDENGILQNSAGIYLYGWPIDEGDMDPNNPSGTTQFNADVSALVPVDVSLAQGQSRLTTEGTLGLNLNADEASRSVVYTAQPPAPADPVDQVVAFPTNANSSSYEIRLALILMFIFIFRSTLSVYSSMVTFFYFRKFLIFFPLTII